MFGFTLGVTVLSGLLFGLVPRTANVATEFKRRLKTADSVVRNRRASESAVADRFRDRALFILLAGAGLLIKSFMHLREINPGFNPDNVAGNAFDSAAWQVPAG